MSTAPHTTCVFEQAIADHIEVERQLLDQQPALKSIALAMQETLHRGGNGGSAADSQHFAAEIVGRFRRERRGLRSIALTTDTSILTSISNDYGDEQVFSRQVEALGNPGDLLFGISTSGNSKNVIRALEAARTRGLVTVAFTGSGGGQMLAFADHTLAISSRDTARIQGAPCGGAHVMRLD